MGFFGALARIVQGKPVFEANQPNAAPQQPQMPTAATPDQSQPYAASGQKVYPQVGIERTTCHTHGSNMDLDLYIQNHSQAQVDLDRLEILGTSRDLGTFLRPGEEREFRVYSGPRPNNTNMSNVQLYIRNQAGDMFCADFHIEFRQEADHTYTTDRIRYVRTRDV
jgi:hypothetical protein